HQRHAVVAIDDRRDAVVGTDLEELRLELLVLADVDRVHRVGQPELLERDGGLAPIGRGPGVEIDHGSNPCYVLKVLLSASWPGSSRPSTSCLLTGAGSRGCPAQGRA